MISFYVNQLRMRLLGGAKSKTKMNDLSHFNHQKHDSFKMLLCALMHGALMIVVCLFIVQLIMWV